MSAAMVREAIKARDGWCLVLWLVAEPHRAQGSHGRLVPSPVGPMRGVVTIDQDPASDAFTFTRWGRGAVRLSYSQVSTWAEVSPPPRPPLPVEQVERP